MKTLYLAGKMTGLPGFNYPLFNETAERLRGKGYEVLNPAETDGGSTHMPREFYLRAALRLLLQADAVAVLKGWGESEGACLEVYTALALGMEIYRAEDMSEIESLKVNLSWS